MKFSLTRLLSLAALALVPATAVLAQDAQPPLKMIVPYSAGGTTDALARLLQKALTDVTHRIVIVENKPGATGTIGTDYVAKAAPDGNTIVFGNQGPNAIVPAVRKTPYDAIADLRPITTVAFMPLALTVSADKGAKNLHEFIEQARKSRGGMNYGSSGIGSFAHLVGHEFSRRAELNMTHVPFKGGSEVVTALVKGDVQGSFLTAMEATPLVQAGRMRMIGVGSHKRMPSLPDVPAIAEEVPGFDAVIWFAVFAPKGTPDAVAERLRDAIVKAVASPDYQKYLTEHNAEGRTSTPQELTELVRKDMKVWGDVVRKANIPM